MESQNSSFRATSMRALYFAAFALMIAICFFSYGLHQRAHPSVPLSATDLASRADPSYPPEIRWGVDVEGIKIGTVGSTVTGLTGQQIFVTLVLKNGTDSAVSYVFDPGARPYDLEVMEVNSDGTEVNQPAHELEQPQRNGSPRLSYFGGRKLYSETLLLSDIYSFSVPSEAYFKFGVEVTRDTGARETVWSPKLRVVALPALQAQIWHESGK